MIKAVKPKAKPPGKQNKFVKPPSYVKVEWQCHQVHYSIHSTQLKLGMRVGFCEHAMRSFTAENIPEKSRFIAGKITKLDLDKDWMEITFDSWHCGLSIQCAPSLYARYCIPKEKP